MSFLRFIRGYFLFNFFCDLFSDRSERSSGRSSASDGGRCWDDRYTADDSVYGYHREDYDRDYDIDDDIYDDFDEY